MCLKQSWQVYTLYFPKLNDQEAKGASENKALKAAVSGETVYLKLCSNREVSRDVCVCVKENERDESMTAG